MCARRVSSGRPAWQCFVRMVVCRGLRALSHLAPSCLAVRAVRGSMAVVASGRSLRAGHYPRGIAGLSKQRYRVRTQWRNRAAV